MAPRWYCGAAAASDILKPVKLAVCSGGGGDSAAIVQQMLAAQRARPEQLPGVCSWTGGSLGWLARADEPRQSLLRQAANGSAMIVTGVPISMGTPLESALGDILADDRPEDRLTQLDGAFAAVLWDNRRRRLIVVTDFLGLQPLYVAEDCGRLLLASELKGIAVALRNVAMDAEGWGAFAGMGHFLGDSTSIEGVRRVPAASMMAWDGDGRKVEDRQYWRWPETVSDEPADTGAIVDVLQREVREYARFHAPGTVLLSGGFDSRLILCLLRRLGYAPMALSASHPGERLDADGRYAREIAAKLGVECRFVTPEPEFYSSEPYRQYLAMNEVANPSLGLFIARVAGALNPEMGAVWEGVAPGYTLAFPRIPRATLADYVRHRCQPGDSTVFAAARMVFRRGEAMRELYELRLAEAVAATPATDPGLLQFEARHQMRNRMGHNPLKVYANDLPCFTPGVSREFWSLASRIPYGQKWDFRLYFRIFREHFPEALRTPFCSAGELWSDRLRLDPHYHAAKLFPPPGAQTAARVLRRFGIAGRPPAIVRRAMQEIDGDLPDLNAEAVARLQREGPRDTAGRSAMTLLFYWHTWRQIMEGRARVAETVLSEAAA
jgi:hypothetical protein